MTLGAPSSGTAALGEASRPFPTAASAQMLPDGVL